MPPLDCRYFAFDDLQLYELSDSSQRKEWLDDWLKFMSDSGKPVTRIPIMAKQVLDVSEQNCAISSCSS